MRKNVALSKKLWGFIWMLVRAPFVYLWWVLKKWKEEHPKILLGLLAGFVFAWVVSWYASRGTVNFIYDGPEVKFESGKGSNSAPKKIEFIERIYVENKTNHPFDVRSKFNAFPETPSGVEKLINKRWKLEAAAGIEEHEEYRVENDGYGKLKPHDYYKAKEVLNISVPAGVSRKDFENQILSLPATIQLISTLEIRYPEKETKVFTVDLPYQDAISKALKDPKSFYPKK